MRAAQFYLKLSADELLEYYQGHKHFVRVHTYEGYSIQFRAEHLRRWVGRHGIHGEFEIRFDEYHKFKELVMCRDFSGTHPKVGGSSQPQTSAQAPPPSPRQRPRGFNKSI